MPSTSNSSMIQEIGAHANLGVANNTLFQESESQPDLDLNALDSPQERVLPSSNGPNQSSAEASTKPVSAGASPVTTRSENISEKLQPK